MSKILCIGDMHFRPTLPYGTYFEDGRRSEWNDSLNLIRSKAAGCDAVVLMGDVLNLKHNHSSVVSDLVVFLKSLGEKQIYIISGNHCRYGDKTALDFLKNIDAPNWHVYTEITNNVKIGTVTASFVPYLTPAMVGAKDKDDGVIKAMEILKPADISFFHHAITGGKVHSQLVDLFNEIVFPIEPIEALYTRIFAGHLHQWQELSEKTTMTGSFFTAEVGEEKKYIFVYDTDTKLTEKIELPERGIYKVTLPVDILKMEKIPTNSIVKCYITDRQVSVEEAKQSLQRFDAHVIIEQYPHQRTKVHFEDGSMDLSLDNILKIYSEAKLIDHESLRRGFDLIK